MSVRLPNGAIISMAATYGITSPLSAFSNANPAVATLGAGHTLVNGDVFELTTGWSRINSQICRALSVATNDVTVEGLNTLDQNAFVPGSGTGSVREILTWQEISQVLTTASKGGDQQFTNYQFLADGQQRQLPSSKNPQAVDLTIADDITLPHYALLDKADDDRQLRAIRVVLPGGQKLYYNAIVSLNKQPTITIDQIMALTVVLSFQAPIARFAS
jgi:Phage tail tube protein, TTP